ncbi:fimbrial biogenesis chaperone [Shewanella gaetbuli]|uniref:Molecular chaperone n=1 Tax=Shewanella gaetbuli TaxID=220752 RepID=A0A9X2CHD4_9GAMM|nr:molecular chaperone [Shewanella gaetbuli]MCL1143373.1 molecular chaperone [Shewanella gaetbuli]
MKYFIFLLCLATSIVSLAIHAKEEGGFSLSSTRMVVDLNKKDNSVLSLSNTSDKDFLVQSWIEDLKGDSVIWEEFIIVPEVFVVKANSSAQIKVQYIGDKHSLSGRENVYYLSVKNIPKRKKDSDKNALLISTRQQIKLFLRPEGVEQKSELSLDGIDVKYQGENQSLLLTNNNLVSLNFRKIIYNNIDYHDKSIILPGESISVPADNYNQEVSIEVINDYGSVKTIVMPVN